MTDSERPIKRIIRLLTVNSVTDLFKYKSFFLLVFGLIALDRVVHVYVHIDRAALRPPAGQGWGMPMARWTFERLPGILADGLSDYRVFLAAAGLFLLKQIVSMWPSSDMRRMHRRERTAFGLFASLLALRWEQVVWDALAIGVVCGVVGSWAAAAYGVTRWCWTVSAQPLWLYLLGLLVFLALPIGMAGFSFSSKLAVLSRGTFAEKMRLYLKLFTDPGIFWLAWVFFLVRVVVETIFVALIPAGAILTIPVFWMRITIASLSATPVYAFLKMATFKFFLELYGRFPLVREEYADYFDSPGGGSD